MKYCPHCGAGLCCPHCGAQNQSGFYCGDCGHSLSPWAQELDALSGAEPPLQPIPTTKSSDTPANMVTSSVAVPLHQREWIQQQARRRGVSTKVFLGALIAGTKDAPQPLGIGRSPSNSDVIFCIDRADYEAFVAGCPKRRGGIAGVVRALIEREIKKGGES